MAQLACGPRGTKKPIPTLEDTYASLMDNFTHIVHLIHRHMAIGHLLKDLWEEACNLRNATARRLLLFNCLWQSEPDETRFEDLREWVAIVKTDST